MRWIVFILFACVVLAFDSSLAVALSLRSVGHVAPSMAGCLATFVAMFAARSSALWAALLLGLLVDLSPGHAEAGGFYVPGPHALGFVLGAFLVLQVRTMLFRRRVPTLGVMTVAFMVLSSLVTVSVDLVRRGLPWADPATPFQAPLGGLFHGIGVALYSGLLALPVGWVLLSSMGMWHFTSHQKRMVWR